MEEFVDSLSMNDKLRKLFGLLDNFDLQDEQLMEALKLAKGYDEILSSIDTLLKLREYLKAYGIEKYISYELGLISDYTYYTGIIFQGYTYGTGEPIVTVSYTHLYYVCRQWHAAVSLLGNGLWDT